MGQPGPGDAVEIWYWRAARQAASNSGEAADMGAVYPDLTADGYPADGGYFSGRQAGNPVSDPGLATRPVHSLAAAGYGSLTTRPADQMRAAGTGVVWRDGVYRVVFAAPSQPREPSLEADFNTPRVPFAVAIWDGAAGDRNGTKLVSQWLTLEIVSPEREGEIGR